MKLRTRLNLVLTGVTTVFFALLAAHQVRDARSSVREELEAAHRVAVQVVGSLAMTYFEGGGLPAVEALLHQIGHVRANEITLEDSGGAALYRAPPAVYKAGRRAPGWYSRLLAPAPARDVITLGGKARLVIEVEPSRAILDAWDDLARLAAIAAALLLLLGGLGFWLVERALAPFPVIVDGLRRLEQGELAFRLPRLPGTEAQTIGAAFNRMAQAVEDKVHAEREAREARARLEERRELALLVGQSVEEERRLIAHELHDEFGQSVTAIRSLAIAIATQSADAGLAATARLISDEAAKLYDAMHGLIPRLRPPALDTLGLAESLQGLVRDWQQRHPVPELTLEQEVPVEPGASVRLAAYRVVQEGLVNALRHARATHVRIELSCSDRMLRVCVADDGVGLPQDWSRPGHFGLRGLAERVEHLGGRLDVHNVPPHGVRLTAEIPLAPDP